MAGRDRSSALCELRMGPSGQECAFLACPQGNFQAETQLEKYDRNPASSSSGNDAFAPAFNHFSASARQRSCKRFWHRGRLGREVRVRSTIILVRRLSSTTLARPHRRARAPVAADIIGTPRMTRTVMSLAPLVTYVGGRVLEGPHSGKSITACFLYPVASFGSVGCWDRGRYHAGMFNL